MSGRPTPAGGRLRVEACGPATSLQDLGRFGLQRFGVSPAGAMDPAMLARANLLVGNAPGEAAVEFCLVGGTFVLEDAPALVAVVGVACTVDGRPAAALTGAMLAPGQRLAVAPPRGSVYAYLAVAGGFAVRADMGSVSVHRRSGIGGRPLRPGDTLALAAAPAPGAHVLSLPALPPAGEGPIRVIPGPQDDLFTPQAMDAFLGETFTVSTMADRMGTRLTGPRLAHAHGYNIVSDGIVTGHVQVPGDGQPIVLMRDRQTTGGYPKIATVISADLARFAQLPPGAPVRFRAVSRAEAVEALARQRDALAEMARRVGPAGGELTSERLLALNLVSGVTAGG